MTDVALSDAELAEHNPDPVEYPAAGPGTPRPLISEKSLDPERSWLKVVCPDGHVLHVQAHEGGSRAFCPQDGKVVDYGGYVHRPLEDAAKAAAINEARAVLEEAGYKLPPKPDREVVDGDKASAVESAHGGE